VRTKRGRYYLPGRQGARRYFARHLRAWPGARVYLRRGTASWAAGMPPNIVCMRWGRYTLRNLMYHPS
jgi:hypothetical protein